MSDHNEKIRVFIAKNIFSPVNGFTFHDWIKLLSKHHFAIAPRYLPRVTFLTFGSVFNSILAGLERKKFEERIQAAEILPPVFILGHWRSGTTHLHNLITIDRQFAYPNFHQATQPHAFLSTEQRISKSRILKLLTPKTRMIDNVRASFDAPMEDEVALCILTSLSPILGSIFPRQIAEYDKYLTFHDAPEAEIARWKEAFVYFLKKLTLRYQRPVVLKSPNHTCRIKILLEMFPEARFIHIHRNPYAVFKSYKRAVLIMNELFQVQKPDLSDLDNRIIEQYRSMYDVFFEERGLIPNGRFFETSFEQLESNPVEQLGSIYEKLNFPGFSAVEPELKRYLQTITDYKKSRLSEFEPALKRKIGDAWRRSFEEWGYEI